MVGVFVAAAMKAISGQTFSNLICINEQAEPRPDDRDEWKETLPEL